MRWSGLERGTEDMEVNEFLKMGVKGSLMLKRKHSVQGIYNQSLGEELILATV